LVFFDLDQTGLTPAPVCFSKGAAIAHAVAEATLHEPVPRKARAAVPRRVDDSIARRRRRA